MSNPKKPKTPSKTAKDRQATSTLAKSDDGTVQITFTIPAATIDQAKLKAALELNEEVEVPGFRKGKAPVEKVINHVSQNTLVEKTLSKVLPKLLADAIAKHKLKPAVHPKFELVSAEVDDDWQIRAITCELPKVKLGEYKKTIMGEAKTKAIWTPDKAEDKKNKPKELNQAEKEQQILQTLLKSINIDIPNVLIDEEVSQRLSALLSRIEKLGLTLENYLVSIGKTAQSLREEYKKQAKEAISLNLILNQIAVEEKVSISQEEVEKATKPVPGDNKGLNSEQKKMVESMLKRRAVLDSLASLL